MTEMEHDIPVIGLVGGIGSGKSAAAACMAELGAVVIDADAIGHDVLADAAVRAELMGRWGKQVLDPAGLIDRRVVAGIVFADPAELAFLNSLTHPHIARRIQERIAAIRAQGQAPAIVLDAAVVLEAGWDRQCTHLVYVHAPPAQRAGRVQRRGWDEQAWRVRENSQISLDSKACRCEYSVDNSSSLSHLREQVHRIFRQITLLQGTD